MNADTTTHSEEGTKGSRLAWHWVFAALLLFIAATWLAWWQAPLPVLANRAEQSYGFLKPIEVNPHRRLDLVPIDIRAVVFLPDGLRGWAVAGGLGTGGAIMHTIDGGASWREQVSPSGVWLDSIHIQNNGKHGWAVGRGGTILHTTDGGATWKEQVSPSKAWLNSIYFKADGLEGWVVGRNGTILHTTNGGKNWEMQSSSATEILNSVHFLEDGMRGWVVGWGGTILHTKDGGANWRDQISPGKELLNSVFFNEDGRHGWAVGGTGGVLHTIDGGMNWTAQITPAGLSLNAVYFHADGRQGWAVARGGYILSTINGGANWVSQTIPSFKSLNSVYFHSDGKRGWVVGDGGAILHTVDAGASWKAQTSPSTLKLNSAHFHNHGQLGWLVGEGGTILHTSDGGKAWKLQTSASKKWLNAVVFHADGERGWVVGREGVILHTTNGGSSWKAQQIPSKELLKSLHFNPEGRIGWTVGGRMGFASGQSLGATILKTTDGGESWKEQSSPTSKLLSSVHFHTNSRLGWAVGDDGTILHTTNGGVDWNAQPSGVQLSLNSVFFHTDGLRGWAVGEAGTILRTIDGGTNWSLMVESSTAWLSSVHFNADGLQGWAVGESATSLHTLDGGVNWTKQNTPSKALLNSVNFHYDGRQGWAVGNAGTILKTIDSGQSWMHAESYSRYPALWYWFAIAVCGWFLWMAWRFRIAATGRDSVADVAASDAAVLTPAQDKLQFAGLARGISRFLRNRETLPPLTLAITGDWGTGKSSLMQLLCEDLKRFGHRPIWFNVWHHQKEDHLFAALLGAVRAQASPPLLTPRGLLFRLRLLWIRSKRHYMSALAILLLFPLAWSLGPLVLKGMQAAATQALTGLLAFWAAVRGMKTFGIDPAVLLKETRSFMSLKAAADQNNLRTQFAREFNDLTRAMPYRLVLVVDDLDRCKPSAVLDVMEAVNYLTSAGDCFVIFGMAPERVKAALGLAFKDIAAEMADMELQAGEQGNRAPDAATQKRRAYANDYLQKLVNIEVKVPVRGADTAHELLNTPQANDPGGFKSVMAELAHAMPMVLAAAAVVVGMMLAGPVATSIKERWPQLKQQSGNNGAAPTPSPSVSAPSDPAPVTKTVVISTSTQPPITETIPHSFERGSGFSVLDVLKWSLLALLPLLLLVAWIVWTVLRSNAIQTKDSKNFRDALKIWAQLVAQKNNTPRFVKRFGNRIRYLAMLQQGEAKDETIWDGVQQQIQTAWQRAKPWGKKPNVNGLMASPAERSGSIAEHQLIALGAIHELAGDKWREAVPQLSDLSDGLGKMGVIDRALLIGHHETTFSTTWPPSDDELKAFERLLSGVRLSGDPEPVPLRGKEEAQEVKSFSTSSSSSAPDMLKSTPNENDVVTPASPVRKPKPAFKTPAAKKNAKSKVEGTSVWYPPKPDA